MRKYVHKKGDSPVFEIDSWKFQKMAYLEFSETSKNVSSFRHLFYSFQGGINDKMLKNYQNYTLVLDFFFFFETMKKSCLKELKFCEVSENSKSSSICWKFLLSILKTGESSFLCIFIFPIWYPFSSLA